MYNETVITERNAKLSGNSANNEQHDICCVNSVGEEEVVATKSKSEKGNDN